MHISTTERNGVLWRRKGRRGMGNGRGGKIREGNEGIRDGKKGKGRETKGKE